MQLKWSNKEPVNYYKDCIKTLGGKPNVIVNKKNGMAKWYNRGNIFIKHVLKDEPNNFFKSVALFYITEEDLPNVLKICDTIMYDNLKKQIIIRSNNLNENVAIFFLIIELLNNTKKLNEIKKNYDLYLKSEITPYNEMTEIVINGKKANNKKYKDQFTGIIVYNNNNNTSKKNSKSKKIKNKNNVSKTMKKTTRSLKPKKTKTKKFYFF